MSILFRHSIASKIFIYVLKVMCNVKKKKTKQTKKHSSSESCANAKVYMAIKTHDLGKV